MSWLSFDWWCRRAVYRLAEMVNAATEVAVRTGRTEGEEQVRSMVQNAQELFVQLALRQLPSGVGWRGDERTLCRDATFRGYSVVVTVKLLDNRPALVRAIREGRLPGRGEVAVTLGVLANGWPVAGYICDIADLVVYFRRPNGNRVWALKQNNARPEMVAASNGVHIRSGAVVVPGDRSSRNDLTRRLLGETFGEVRLGPASPALSLMGVLAGRLAGVLLVAGRSTPWDDAPLEAMCGQGLVAALCVDRQRLSRMSPHRLDEARRRRLDTLYVAERHVAQIR